jgi:two-component system, NarL family, nitrate/nitrite response regulator NarL
MSEPSSQKVRVLLIDDHALFREGVARFLAAEPDLEMAAHCGSVDEALAILGSTPVDVVLLDFDLGPEKGTRFLVSARGRGFEGKTLVVTAGLSDAEVTELLRLGVAGIFLKHNSPAMLTKAIRKVMEGEAWLDQRYLRVLVDNGTEKAHPQEPRLTEREREVLRAVLEGLANKEIAARLNVSESSVKATLQQLFSKTGVRTRGQLVRVALEQYKDYL